MTEAQHPRHALDDQLTAPIRLSIMAALDKLDEVDFAALRDAIELSDSVLSKQLAQLETAGYVSLRKGYVGKRPRTWASATKAGRSALAAHLAALRALTGL
ncbi:transcriptional regulator [Arenivirga flava]|uniref:Winged helix DNA-binding domain-containing protein n=1 Tax=Arenivirga flava TaxID=1930060 RepID=A0AA37UCS0_9MICO|nr:transcriptional regulator [Arenivirga flava]GMA26903.1 hypothetical protein GCM10025874_01560 [Arenivirga flava]